MSNIDENNLEISTNDSTTTTTTTTTTTGITTGTTGTASTDVGDDGDAVSEEKQMLERAKNFISMGKEEEGLILLQETKKKFPNSFECYNLFLQLSPCSIYDNDDNNDNNIEQELEKFESLAKTEEEKSLVMIYKGFIMNEKVEETMDMIEQLLKKFPQSCSILLVKLIYGIKSRRLTEEEVRECADRIISSPNSQAFDKARACYLKLLDFKKKNEKVSSMEKLMKESSEKMNHLEEVLSYQPFHLGALEFKGELHLLRNEFDEAKNCANLIMQANNKTVTPYILLSKISLLNENHEEALEYVEKAFHLEKDNTIILNALYGLYYHSDRNKLKKLITPLLSDPNIREHVHFIHVITLFVEFNFEEGRKYALERIKYLQDKNKEFISLPRVEKIVQSLSDKGTIRKIVAEYIPVYEMFVQYSKDLTETLKKFPALVCVVKNENPEKHESILRSTIIDPGDAEKQTKEVLQQCLALIRTIWFSEILKLPTSSQIDDFIFLLNFPNLIDKLMRYLPEIVVMMCDATIIKLTVVMFQISPESTISILKKLFDNAKRTYSYLYCRDTYEKIEKERELMLRSQQPSKE